MPARGPKAMLGFLAVLTALVAAPRFAAAQTETVPPGDDGAGGVDTTAPGFIPNEPAAWILVDADTGAVLDGRDPRTPHLPASTIKLFTALVATQRLAPETPVPISERAAGMPARKINVGAGQVWGLYDLLFSMLTVSANDAAVAVAERVGNGSLTGWEAVANRTATALGLSDTPDFSDPAGLDDEFSNGEGSRISARDLAIIARAVMAEPTLMTMVSAEEHRFTGGDGIPHRVDRRNRMFELYPGSIGMKTGLTDAAGRCLVAAATRDGRTMLAVMFDAPDMYASAAVLLDRGFATPVGSEPAGDVLPAVVAEAAIDPPEPVPGALPVRLGVVVDVGSGRLGLDDPPVALAVVLIGTFPALVIRQSILNGRRRPRPSRPAAAPR